jgi:hypothetical protein
MDEFFLPAHVHCCRRGDAFVFLDLKQDDYTLIVGDAAAALCEITTQPRAGASGPQHAQSLHELVRGGLLTPDSASGRMITATRSDIALQQLLDADSTLPVGVTISHVCNFIAACTTAAIRLRWSRIENTISAVSRRKAVRSSRHPMDLDRARHLAGIFQRLRRLFPANYLCLFDSLALLEFLARYDVFPTWVFGVRLEPWAAHCWLQHEEFTFNECVEEVSRYTPIMVI